MGIQQKIRKPLAIAIATASAFLAVPLTTSFLQAQTIENATFTVKTAGQPDRILRVISYKKYSDGESLAQVQDVATGHTFMMPGKVVEAQLKISPIKTTDIAKAVATAEAQKETAQKETPVSPATPITAPVAPVTTPAAPATPVAANPNFTPAGTGTRYPTAIPSQFRESTTQEFQPGTVTPRPMTVPVHGSTAALASGSTARPGSYIANKPPVAAYAPRPTVSETPPVMVKPEVVVAPVAPTIVEPKVVVVPKPAEPVKVAVTPAPTPPPSPVFAPQPTVVPKAVTPNVQHASANSDVAFGQKPMTVIPSAATNLKPQDWKQITPAVATVPAASNSDRWQPLASPIVQVVHKNWAPIPQTKETCTDCWQPDSQIRPVVSIERDSMKLTVDQQVKEATQGLIYDLTTCARPTDRETAASKLKECAFSTRPEVRCALLRSAVGDSAPSVRAHCIDCLSALGYDDKDYRDHLQAVSTTGPSAVRSAAKEALSKMK